MIVLEPKREMIVHRPKKTERVKSFVDIKKTTPSERCILYLCFQENYKIGGITQFTKLPLKEIERVIDTYGDSYCHALELSIKNKTKLFR